MLPELTHYERVMRGSLPYDKEGQSFAQRAVSSGRPAFAFSEFLRTTKARSVRPGMTEKEAIASLIPLSSRAMNYTHHIFRELLLKQKRKSSFTELTTNADVGEILAFGCVSRDAQIINSAGHMHYHMAAHRIAGRKVYAPSSALADQLRNTELRGLTADDLKLPFQSIYIMVPDGTGLQVYNAESDWHPVVGMYLSEDVDSSGNRCWRFLVCGAPKPIEVLPGITDDNDALIYFHVPLPEKMALTDAVALAQVECIKDVEDLKRHQITGFDRMVDKWQDLFRWAMNVVLYTSMETSEQEDVVVNEEAKRILEQMKGLASTSKKRHRLGERLSQMQQCRRVVLGRSVVRKGWQLSVKVLVSGHWRNQPYGPERSLRRLQWIEPYWKGNDELATTTTEVASATSGTGGTDHEPRNGAGDSSPVGVGSTDARQSS